MKRNVVFVVLLLVLIGAGIADYCWYRSQQKEDILEGEVFIRTRGGESIPLSLVEVRFADYDETQKVLTDLFHRQPPPYSYAEVFAALPPPQVATRTDSQGHFTVRLPHSKRFAVMAHDAREVGFRTEEYYWCVSYPNIWGQRPAKLTLANDNLASQGDIYNSMLPSLQR